MMARNQRASLYVLLAGTSSSFLSSYWRPSMLAAARMLVLGAFVAVAVPAGAQTALPLKHAPARTHTAITPSDLMTRVYLYADDSMMGRMAGSEYNLKATAYIASEVQRMGLVPAGDSGGYFQNVPLVKRGLDANATLSVDGTTLTPWVDFVPRDPGRATRAFDGAPVIYGGVWTDSTMISPDQAAGKFVVLAAHSGPNVPQAQQVNRGAILSRYRGAAGIAVAALETFPPQVIAFFRNPQTSMKRDAAAADTPSVPVYVYVNGAAARTLLGGGAPLDSLRAGAQRRRDSARQRSAAARRVRRDRRAQRPHRVRSDAGGSRFHPGVQRCGAAARARGPAPRAPRDAGPGAADPRERGQPAPGAAGGSPPRLDLQRGR